MTSPAGKENISLEIFCEDWPLQGNWGSGFTTNNSFSDSKFHGTPLLLGSRILFTKGSGQELPTFIVRLDPHYKTEQG
jgi:hypothetical protein